MNADEIELLVDHEKLAAEKKRHEEAYSDRQKFLEDWRNGVLNTAAGRRIVWDILGLAGYQRKLFNSDPLVMAANCGTHDNFLLVMINDLEEAQPGILFKMQNEFIRTQNSKG